MAEQNREAGHALTADDADFDRLLSAAVGDDGGKAALGKIDAVDPPVRLLQDLADRKVHVFEVGFDELKSLSVRRDRMRLVLAGCHWLFPRRGKSAAHLPAVRALKSGGRCGTVARKHRPKGQMSDSGHLPGTCPRTVLFTGSGRPCLKQQA